MRFFDSYIYCRLQWFSVFFLLPVLLVFMTLGFGCGEGSDKPGFFIAGTLSYDASLRINGAPVIIAVTTALDARRIQDDPGAVIIKYMAAGDGGTTFHINLTDTLLKPGDKITLIAFIDNNYRGEVPFPDLGDIIGIHMEPGRMSPILTLQNGGNTGIHININREVFDYEASISGTIEGNDAGDVILVAYAGDIVSSDFSGLDTDAVMGYTLLEKGAEPAAYTIDILPYGRNAPLENVQVFALLDANANNEIDGGDRIGFYGRGDDFSTLLTLIDGSALTDIDLEFKRDVHPPSGDAVGISGDITLPPAFRPDQGHLYLVVFDGSDTGSLMDDFFASIRYFTRLPAGAAKYTIDLSDTGLGIGDKIMVAGLWDRDFTAGFPDITPGDYMGIYFAAGGLSPNFELVEGPDNIGNPLIHININREVFDYEASISGTIEGNDAGDVILVAYAGDIVSSDFSGLDTDAVMGYTLLEKGAEPAAYTIDILPYGRNAPLENVQVFALLDANANNEIDGGDRIGFYGRGGVFSSMLALADGSHLEEIDISFRFNVPTPSGYDVSITGTFSVPDGYTRGDSPVYITVFDADSPEDIIDDPYGPLKYFYKMPDHEFYFNRDLSHTDLAPGDRVIVAGLWDRDFAGGFPRPTRSDKLGIVVNKDTYQFLTELSCGRNVIPPVDYEFKINKLIYDFSACIHYALDLSDAGSFNMDKARLMVLAIHVEGVKFGVSFAGDVTLDIDMDYMLAADILPATAYDYIGIGQRRDPLCSRNLPILRALYEQIVVWENNRPPEQLIKGVDHGQESERTAFLVAVLDKNGNGALDREDEIGYYGKTAIEVISGVPVDELPECIEIIIAPWFSGTLYLPVPIKRIVNGHNHELRDDGSDGPFWIENFTRAP
jgi:hypothetical protein